MTDLTRPSSFLILTQFYSKLSIAFIFVFSLSFFIHCSCFPTAVLSYSPPPPIHPSHSYLSNFSKIQISSRHSPISNRSEMVQSFWITSIFLGMSHRVLCDLFSDHLISLFSLFYSTLNLSAYNIIHSLPLPYPLWPPCHCACHAIFLKCPLSSK